VMQTRRSPPAAVQRTFWVGSLLLAMLAWIPTIEQSRGMWSMPGTMGMSLGAFLVFWTLMMVAMMGPSVAPITLLHLETVRLRTHRPHMVAHVGAFVMGYLLVWTVFGLPIFGLAGLEGHFVTTAPPIACAAGAVVLVVAGCYQLTPLRERCLASCNGHLGVQAHLPSGTYPLQTVRAGLAHGLDCLGACGGCMLVLVAVGLMNIPWMIVLTLLILVEKVWRYGERVAVLVGVGLVLVGILTAVDPRLILGWS
jgi:predicted metal-binding membrane protein